MKYTFTQHGSGSPQTKFDSFDELSEIYIVKKINSINSKGKTRLIKCIDNYGYRKVNTLMIINETNSFWWVIGFIDSEEPIKHLEEFKNLKLKDGG